MSTAPRIESRRRALLSAIPLAATLCAIAGAIDVIAYLRFGKVFIANMTGNTVLFAASILGGHWPEAGPRIGLVAAFLCGGIAARAGWRRLGWDRNFPKRNRGIRLAALAIVFILLCVMASIPHPVKARVLLLVLLAFALSMQNVAFWRIGPIRLNTSFISSDIEKLGDAIAGLANIRKRKNARLRAALFGATWLAYACGALFGAFGASYFANDSLWIPAGLAVLAAVLVLTAAPG